MATIKFLKGVPVPQAYSDALNDYEAIKSTNGSLHVKTDALPAGSNIIGLVKLSDGTDAMAVNTNGSINIVNINSAGAELFTVANPGQVSIGSIVEVEVKNDLGNPLSADITDRSARALGKVTADDAALAQLGALAAAAVTNPASSASVIALLKGLLTQLQGSGSGKTPILNQTETMTVDPVTSVVTLTETPVAITTKANLKQITVRNRDASVRARIGETGMTPANDKGYPIEPGAAIIQEFDPATAITLYARSEGAAIQVEVIQY